MQFLTGEAIIATPLQGVVLTNYRIRAEGTTTLTSIMLDQVSHVRATWHANTGLLLVAFLAALVGGLIGYTTMNTSTSQSSTRMDAIMIGFLVAVVFIIMYFASRYSLVTVSSSGGMVRIQTNAKFATCTDFLEKLEAAKHTRTDVLYSL